MLRKLWFQFHWLLGISAGVVLAVIGTTGAMLSFEEELLRAINPGVMTVAARAGATPLTPPVLLERVAALQPGRRVTSFTVSADKEASVRVAFEGGLTQYFDPYTGAALGSPRGMETFRQIRNVHRRLAAGEPGKQVVGACTIALLLSSLSGLYLRWPRNPWRWRTWLVIDFARKGRGFLWNVHAVLGTWVLVPYLVMGLTGLYWSYDWYRDALFALTGAPPPVRQASTGRAQPADLPAVWGAFQAQAHNSASATVRLPAASAQPVLITYLDIDAPHDRAFNRVLLDPARGAVLQHERYADKAAGAKLMSSILALHTGRFAGLSGSIALMLASLLMPFFTITGWVLYVGRRARRGALPVAA